MTRLRILGFTLIELLVVISIVALLMSILLPSLKKARQNAVSIQCLSKMRQLTIPMTGYIADSKEYFPIAATFYYSSGWQRDPSEAGLGQFYDQPGTVIRNKNWTDRLMPYLGATGPLYTSSGGMAPEYANLREVFYCPATLNKTPGSVLGNYKDYTHYGLNMYTQDFVQPFYGLTPASRTKDVKRPSEVFLLVEKGINDGVNVSSGVSYAYAFDNNWFLHFRRHGDVSGLWQNCYSGSTGSANYIYPDMHGGSVNGDTFGLVSGASIGGGVRQDLAFYINNLWNAAQ
jgi:prepilin-type N-terminal cleavage/methylation domain-containing protein